MEKRDFVYTKHVETIGDLENQPGNYNVYDRVMNFSYNELFSL
jgi:hypothetical protein